MTGKPCNHSPQNGVFLNPMRFFLIWGFWGENVFRNTEFYRLQSLAPQSFHTFDFVFLLWYILVKSSGGPQAILLPVKPQKCGSSCCCFWFRTIRTCTFGQQWEGAWHEQASYETVTFRYASGCERKRCLSRVSYWASPWLSHLAKENTANKADTTSWRRKAVDCVGFFVCFDLILAS